MTLSTDKSLLLVLAIWSGAACCGNAAETTDASVAKPDVAKLLVVDSDTVSQSRRLPSVSALPLSDNDVIVPWLQANTDRLEPEYLYELSRRLVDTNPAVALEWFSVARARVDYDESRCADPRTANNRAPFLSGRLARTVLQYMREHQNEGFGEAYDRAIQRKDLLVDTMSPLWICAPDAEGQPGGTAPAQSAALKPESEWPQIATALRDNLVWNRGSPIVPDETTVFGSIRLRRAARIWIGGGVEAIALSPDGRTLAAQSMAADFIDPATGKIGRSLTGLEPDKDFHWNSAQRIAVSPSGRYIGIMFQNPRFAPAAIYDASSLRLLRTISIPNNYIEALAFSPDDERVAVGSISGDVQIYDLKTGEMLGSNRARRSHAALAFSPDGRRLVSVGSAVEILDGSTGALLQSQSGDERGFYGAAWSPEGRFIATYSRDGALRLWTSSLDASETIQKFPIFATAASEDVFFSADGKRLALGIGSVAVVWELSER